MRKRLNGVVDVIVIGGRARSRIEDAADRWSGLTWIEARTWRKRSKSAAQKLVGQSGVADMGCGWMTLERYLSAQTKYVPVDLVARDRRTIVRDFNKEPPPATGMPAVACLGLLGYLHRPDLFMSALAGLHQLAVVSYKVADADPSGLDRQSEALVNGLLFRDGKPLHKFGLENCGEELL
jgi:hypothetical protein